MLDVGMFCLSLFADRLELMKKVSIVLRIGLGYALVLSLDYSFLGTLVGFCYRKPITALFYLSRSTPETKPKSVPGYE